VIIQLEGSAATAAGPRPLRILGLDLSMTATGVCLPDGTTHTITTRPKDGDQRLHAISEALYKLTVAGIDLAVIEDLPTHAKSAGITGMVHGAARVALIKAGVPYVLITPATLKAYATGKGNADKTAMAMAAFKRAGREFGDDNQCDAWWLRAAGLDWYGQPEFVLPQAQRIRLAKVQWSDLGAVAS
jgi:Holliday junction resolvasome RuvABC endonuclease subunit